MKYCLSMLAGAKECVSKDILDHITDKVIIWDNAYRCIYANDSMVNFFKAPDFTIVGNKIQDWYPAFSEIGIKWKQRIDDVLSSGKSIEYNDRDKINGAEVYSESILIPLKDCEESPASVLLIFKNLTDKILLQRELDLNKNFAELGKTLSFLTHEIKTPLNSILMNIDILNEDRQITGSKKNSIMMMQHELRRLSRMIKGIMKFVQIPGKESQIIDIHAVICNIHNLIRPLLIQNNITLNYDCRGSLILGNPHDIESVFLEMINNSIEAIGTGGNIDIFTDQNESNEISIFIKDSGIGIDDPDKIFLPFYSTKKEGNGIGLPQIVKTLNNMKASIRLVSSQPGNTLFELIFSKQKD